MSALGQRTLLINPPLINGIAFTRQGRCQEREEVLGTTKPPYTLAVLASLLREAGMDVRLVDATASRITIADVMQRLDAEGFAPTLIVFPTTTPTIDADVAAIGSLKQRYGAPMFCFGPHASTVPAASMHRPSAAAVDGMFVGEPEDGVRQLASLTSLDQLGEVPNLTWRKGDAVVPHRAHGSFAGFLQLPFPAWDLLDLENYSLPLVDRPYVIVETSRGCPYSCDFCVAPIHQGHKFRERSAKALVDEIERGYRELGVEFFYLWGDTVTLNVKSFTAFCDELIARQLPIQWFGNARADNLTDPAFVHRLKRAGCWMLALGIESESDEVRKDMVKRLERQKIQAAFHNMRSAGIKSFAFFIFGYPGETLATMDQTTRYAIELDPDFANFYPAVPYPGTALHDKCAREGLLGPDADDWSRMEYSVLSAAGQRARRVGRDAEHQPREAPVLPEARLHGEASRRRRAAGADQAGDRLARVHPDGLRIARRRCDRAQARFGAAPLARSARRQLGRTMLFELLQRHTAVSLLEPRLRAPEPMEVAKLDEITRRFLQVHLAFAGRAPFEHVGHFDHGGGTSAHEELEADLETPGGDLDAARQVAPDQKEAGGRVADRRQACRQPAGPPRHDQPSERPATSASTCDVAARHDDIGVRAAHHRQHSRQEARRVTHVGVDDADDGGRRSREPFDDRGAKSELAGSMDHANPVPRRELVRERTGAVRRVVVDDDQLGIEPFGAVGGKDRRHQLRQSVTLVVRRNDDRQGWDVLRRLDHVAIIL